MRSAGLRRGNSDIEQLKAFLAFEIIKALDGAERTVRAADDRLAFAAAGLSRFRNAGLARFAADRVTAILNRLGARVEVKVRVPPLGASSTRGECLAKIRDQEPDAHLPVTHQKNIP
jgi:Helix-turn-helix domain